MDKNEYLNEIWLPIKEYEGLYDVSNYGRIRSHNYLKKGITRILKLSAKPNTYIKVGLYKDGTMRYHRVHRLVAEAFLPPPSEGQTQVNHIDGNKHNNFASNLEWCTPWENVHNPNTMKNHYIRYHREGEAQRRSEGQRRRYTRERQTKTGKYASLRA